MTGVYYLIPTLITIIVSILIVRGGAIALVMTGMAYDSAKFQALSAFSGTGFTTREAERAVSNVRRRRIISVLMILGNAGIVTVIVTATSSFANATALGAGLNALVLLAGVGAIVAVARHAPLVKRWEAFAHDRLSRLRIFDDDATLDELLHIEEGYSVVRIRLDENSAQIGKSLADVNSELRHSFVLGIEHNRRWVPLPHLARELMADDCLVIYGQIDELESHFASDAAGTRRSDD